MLNLSHRVSNILLDFVIFISCTGESVNYHRPKGPPTYISKKFNIIYTNREVFQVTLHIGFFRNIDHIAPLMVLPKFYVTVSFVYLLQVSLWSKSLPTYVAAPAGMYNRPK